MISKQEAENAVLTLLKYINPHNSEEVLQNTPKRVVKSFEELFSGYKEDPKMILGEGFENEENYSEKITIQDINFTSFCEHHILPIRGVVKISYIPGSKIIGLSKAARLVNIYAKRLQLQERMTAQIAKALYQNFHCKSVEVEITATHDCMSSRGVNRDAFTVTRIVI